MMGNLQPPDEFVKKHFVKVGEVSVCYRTVGLGPAVALFHGYPLSGRTWRKVVPELSRHFTCYAFDMVGLGETTSPHASDHSSQGQAKVFQAALTALGISRYSLIGNDSGGWIARELALLEPTRVKRLILTNTEIPGHRPPWIRPYQLLARLPGAGFVFRSMISSRRWRHSNAGFGGCFQDLELIDGEFAEEFLLPLLLSHDSMCRALLFLKSMKFRRIDQFKELHHDLNMPVVFIWGAADPTFPEKLAREMASQFRNVLGFRSIPNANLFVQEEFPEAVAETILESLAPEQ